MFNHDAADGTLVNIHRLIEMGREHSQAIPDSIVLHPGDYAALVMLARWEFAKRHAIRAAVRVVGAARRKGLIRW